MTFLRRWTDAVVHVRVLVLGCWLVIAAAGAISALQLPGMLTTSLVVPGSASERAGHILTGHFGQNPDGTFVVVTQASRNAGAARDLQRRIQRAAQLVPRSGTTRVRTVNGIAYGTIVSPFDLQEAQPLTARLRKSLLSTGGAHAYVTGVPAIQYDLNPVLASDLARGEAIALPAAALVLVLVLGLRTLLIVPLAFAAATISAALGAVWLIAHVYAMSSYVPNLVELMGLGLAIDYSLLFVHRFREEVRREVGTPEAAVARTMETAGRTVLFSGAAVAVGLVAVLIMPVPFIRSMGVAGVVVPVVALVAALTVQPALLSLIPDRGLRRPASAEAEGPGAIWTRVASTVTTHPRIWLAATLILLLGFALPVARLQMSPGSLASIPRSTDSGRGLALLRSHVGGGALTPIDIVAATAGHGKARSRRMSNAVLQVGERLLRDPQVFVVQIGSKPPWVDRSGRFVRMQVIPRRTFSDGQTLVLVRRIRTQFIPAVRLPLGATMLVGGAPAQAADFLDRVYEVFPWMAGGILALAYLVLLRAFRSVVLPLAAVALDVISVAATCGLLVLIFRYGVGSRLVGLDVETRIEAWIPVLLCAALFGLSMDYQVFLVTRMRESWDLGQEARDAVGEGLARTGRIVTAAAVIMVISFSGFIAGRVAGLQEFGTGLAIGVLLDATVVRIILLPSMMTLLGPWCWWFPDGLAQLARVQAPPPSDSGKRGLRSNR